MGLSGVRIARAHLQFRPAHSLIHASKLFTEYHTFGGLPDFPFIGGAQAIEGTTVTPARVQWALTHKPLSSQTGWDSTNCGTCWELAYNGTKINVLAIDHAGSGFNIAKTAMDALTHGQAGQLGVVQATSTQVDKSVCGL